MDTGAHATRNHSPHTMRLLSWLKPSLASLGTALAAYRFNARAGFFAVACWLVWSGWSDWSPRGAKVALGFILLHALHRSDSAQAKPKAKT